MCWWLIRNFHIFRHVKMSSSPARLLTRLTSISQHSRKGLIVFWYMYVFHERQLPFSYDHLHKQVYFETCHYVLHPCTPHELSHIGTYSNHYVLVYNFSCIISTYLDHLHIYGLLALFSSFCGFFRVNIFFFLWEVCFIFFFPLRTSFFYVFVFSPTQWPFSTVATWLPWSHS